MMIRTGRALVAVTLASTIAVATYADAAERTPQAAAKGTVVRGARRRNIAWFRRSLRANLTSGLMDHKPFVLRATPTATLLRWKIESLLDSGPSAEIMHWGGHDGEDTPLVQAGSRWLAARNHFPYRDNPQVIVEVGAVGQLRALIGEPHLRGMTARQFAAMTASVLRSSTSFMGFRGDTLELKAGPAGAPEVVIDGKPVP